MLRKRIARLRRDSPDPPWLRNLRPAGNEEHALRVEEMTGIVRALSLGHEVLNCALTSQGQPDALRHLANLGFSPIQAAAVLRIPISQFTCREREAISTRLRLLLKDQDGPQPEAEQLTNASETLLGPAQTPSNDWTSDLSEAAPFHLTKKQALELCAALHLYLRFIERDGTETSRSTDSDAEAYPLHAQVGRWIWRLEEASAWPRSVGEHSADAVRP